MKIFWRNSLVRTLRLDHHHLSYEYAPSQTKTKHGNLSSFNFLEISGLGGRQKWDVEDERQATAARLPDRVTVIRDTQRRMLVACSYLNTLTTTNEMTKGASGRCCKC